jgi:hypothetical protein
MREQPRRDRSVITHGASLDESESWPWLMSHVAVYLWSRGRFRQTLTLQRQALAARRRLFGHLWEVISHPRYRLGANGGPEVP